MSRIIGIDLGTTFSAVGHVQAGRPTILPNGAERIVPSVVGFTPEDKLVVGAPARNQYVLYPERTVRSIKRKMGSDETVTLNGRSYPPTEISAIILREMKRIAEANLGESVSQAVITVPAFFSDAARQATKDAGEIAGFTVERILNEPTAAALAYGLDRLDEQQIVAVYDLGGGTFDVSLIELNAGVTEVRASHGDTHLGGDDFDARLVEHLAKQFKREHDLDPRDDRKALARLTRAAEQAKIELSGQPFVRVREEYLLEKDGRPLHLNVEIARHEFEELIRDLIVGTLTAFDQALKDAELSKEDLDKVLFVGGSTRIPLVWELVANHMGLEPMMEINPDEAVALGAGVQAALIAGVPLDVILVDVTPHSLGIEVVQWLFGRMIEDRYSPIIRRNTTLPTSRAEVFSAITPDQKQIQFKVYQGEAPAASQNTLLGEFLFEDLEQEVPGRPPRVTVQFDLDLNGILHVGVLDRGSGQTTEATMQAAHARLSTTDKEASARFVAGLETAKLDETEALLFRARAVLAAYADDVEADEDLQRLAETVTALEAARQAGDDDKRAKLTDELLDLLYEFEPDEGDDFEWDDFEEDEEEH